MIQGLHSYRCTRLSRIFLSSFYLHFVTYVSLTYVKPSIRYTYLAHSMLYSSIQTFWKVFSSSDNRACFSNDFKTSDTLLCRYTLSLPLCFSAGRISFTSMKERNTYEDCGCDRCRTASFHVAAAMHSIDCRPDSPAFVEPSHPPR